MKAPLLIVAAILGLSLAVAACDDSEEQFAPGLTPTPAPSGPSPPVVTPMPTPAPGTPVPVPSGWTRYTDPVAGFSVPYAGDLAVSEKTSVLREQKSDSSIEQRVVVFTRRDGITAFYVATAPNTGGLSLEDWIKTYPGWPTDPEVLTVAGRPALRFSRNALDELDARVYVAQGATVYTLAGNVFGSGEGGYGPGITASDFEAVLQLFRLAP